MEWCQLQILHSDAGIICYLCLVCLLSLAWTILDMAISLFSFFFGLRLHQCTQCLEDICYLRAKENDWERPLGHVTGECFTVFPQKGLSQNSAPSGCDLFSVYWCLRLFLLECRTLHFPLLNFMWFISLLMKFNKQVAALYGSPTTWCTSHFPQFCVFETDEGGLHLLLQVLMKSYSSTGPSIDPWCIPPVTGLQLSPSLFNITLQTWLFSGFSIHLTVSLSFLASLKKLIRNHDGSFA